MKTLIITGILIYFLVSAKELFSGNVNDFIVVSLLLIIAFLMKSSIEKTMVIIMTLILLVLIYIKICLLTNK